MRKKIAVMVMVMSLLTVAAPAMASNTRPERQATTTTQVVETRPVEGESEARLRRFCAANPDHERCQRQDGEVNARHLIWRLVKAGEWRQLFHLLNRLGII